MRSSRSILSVQYTAVGAGARKAVGGFLRYVHYRDHEQRGDTSRGLGGLVRYVAYRDQASPQGRLFTKDGIAGDRERRQLVRYVGRSIQPLLSRLDDERAPRARAVYRFVLSPEDARGLDLRRLARQTMQQLEKDAGPGGLPPWMAAEHRNTAHPHVHIVMAAQREVAPGQFRGLQVTRQRLARMKQTMAHEILRQRGARTPQRSLEHQLLETSRQPAVGRNHRLHQRLTSAPLRSKLARHDPLRWRRRSSFLPEWQMGRRIQRAFAAMARHNHQMEREAELIEWRRRLAAQRQQQHGRDYEMEM